MSREYNIYSYAQVSSSVKVVYITGIDENDFAKWLDNNK